MGRRLSNRGQGFRRLRTANQALLLAPAACEDERSNAWYQWVGAFRGDPRWVGANTPGTHDAPAAAGRRGRVGTRTPRWD